MSLEKDLAAVLNRYSRENASNTPDFILAQYLAGCLNVWDNAVRLREHWYGRMPNTDMQWESKGHGKPEPAPPETKAERCEACGGRGAVVTNPAPSHHVCAVCSDCSGTGQRKGEG